MSTLDMPSQKLLRSTGRRLHRRMATLNWPDPELPKPRATDIQLATAFVNVLVFSLGFVEVLQARRVINWRDLDAIQDTGPILAELRATTGMTIDEAERSVATLVRRVRANYPGHPEADDRHESMQVIHEQILRSTGEFLRTFPLREVCELARALQMTESAHHLQTAAEQVRAIYNRLHAPASEPFRIAALAYANGSIELDIAAKLLGLDRSDLVAAFESHGFSRTPAVIALDPAHRSAILARIRKERIDRAGKPVQDAALLARDVIASQRIEGVDARRWLPR